MPSSRHFASVGLAAVLLTATAIAGIPGMSGAPAKAVAGAGWDGTAATAHTAGAGWDGNAVADGAGWD